MKLIFSIIILTFSLVGHAQETNLKKYFSDGSIQTMNLSFAKYDFESKKRHVFYVWASWCPHCRADAPAFLEQYEDAKKCSGLNVSLINVDATSDEGRKALKDYNFNDLPSYYDGQGMVKRRIKSGIPKMLIVDNQGEIIEMKGGRGSAPRALKELVSKLEQSGDCR